MAVTLWHVTSASNADQIEAGGFRDGPFREDPGLMGVYLADTPTWADKARTGDVVFALVFADESALRDFEVVEDAPDKRWREWFVPAKVVNQADRYRVLA